MKQNNLYERVKSDFQHSIKCTAERNHVNPLDVLTAKQGNVYDDLMSELETIVDMINVNTGTDKKTVWQMYDEFRGEVTRYACPDWNSTINEKDIYSHLNRRLAGEGYSTISPEILEFLFDEIQQMKRG